MGHGIPSGAVYRTDSASGQGGTDGTAVTAVQTAYSAPTDVSRCGDSGYQLAWTGTPTGVFTVQVSNRDRPVLTSDAEWSTLALAIPIVQPAGSAGADYVDLALMPFHWVRLKYVNASGTGVVFAYVSGKGA